MTPRRPKGDREDSLRDPPPLRTPIGRLGILYILLLLIEKPPENISLTKLFNLI
jgi:hypothetical protein